MNVHNYMNDLKQQNEIREKIGIGHCCANVPKLEESPRITDRERLETDDDFIAGIERKQAL